MSRQQSNSNNDATLWDQSDAASCDEQPDDTGDALRRADKLVTAILSFKRLGWLKADKEDYRQDVLVSLLAKLKRLNEPGVEPIKDYDAYVVQSSFNHFKKRQRAKLNDPATKSLDTDLDVTSADARPSQDEVIETSEAVKHAWRECVALMNSEQLAVFLFDRNDILWQLICINDPISLDEIAEALTLTPRQLEQIMNRLPCKSDRELSDLIGIKVQRIHKLRSRMKRLLPHEAFT